MKIIRHSVYNLLGLGLPLLVAVFTIPVLIKDLGDARFGLLTLIWAVVSYFGLFDMGLGRALTQQLAVVLANKQHERIGPLVATATVLMAGLGVFAGVLMAALAPWGVSLIHGVPDQQEAVNAMYAMALAMPAIVLTSGFRGILEAKHAFGIVNLIRFPMGLFTFLGPLVVVMYGEPRLDWIAGVLAVGRVIACIVHAWYAWRVLPREHGSLTMHANLLQPLSVSGGWMTVSNIISPFMGYVDRFVIGVIVSASAVAYYTTPNELVTKLWIVPGALTAVLFPTLAAKISQYDGESLVLFRKAMYWLFLLMLPVTISLVLFAHNLLSMWVGSAFAEQSTLLLQIFSLGMLLSSLGQIPFTVIKSAGRSGITALIHACELPFYLLLLWWLVSSFGALGAACAWLTRILLDTGFMLWGSMLILRQPLTSLFNMRLLARTLFAVVGFSGTFLYTDMSRMLWILSIVIIVSILFFASIRQVGTIDVSKG